MTASPDEQVRETLAWLERQGTRKNRDGMARYGIVAKRAFGVSVAALRDRAKRLGKDHDLALALWETGWYEARMLAALGGSDRGQTRVKPGSDQMIQGTS